MGGRCKPERIDRDVKSLGTSSETSPAGGRGKAGWMGGGWREEIAPMEWMVERVPDLERVPIRVVWTYSQVGSVCVCVCACAQ